FCPVYSGGSCAGPSDTLRLAREQSSSITIGAAVSYFPAPSVGIQAEMAYLGLPLSDACTVLNASPSQPSRQLCANMQGASHSTGAISFAASARPIGRRARPPRGPQVLPPLRADGGPRGGARAQAGAPLLPGRAAVPAGGPARRYGGRPKGLVELGGRRILDRVVDAVQAVVGEPPLLVANAPEAPTWRPDLRTIPDVRPGCGSLGGIYTAVVSGAGEAPD